MLGDIGHIGIIVSLVASLMAVFAYYQFQVTTGLDKQGWKKMARLSFVSHFVGAVVSAVALFLIIYNHHYEYHYAWKHSSNTLPIHFIVSCFWEGQEGSFLVWIIWNAVIGLILIQSAKARESIVMIVFSVIQFGLLTMILGISFGDLKIGSSPFILLKDAMDIPVFQTNPDFVPQDGTGLNPLLQNIWMVIHPPVIFLGFALSAVPFAYCLSGLFTKDLKNWIPQAQVWLLITVGVLGLGIMMGAYWAYETLNFGGYWNWDPVENAVLIPWLVMLAGVHGIILYQKRNQGLFFSTVLILGGFVLVVYATFLTRSGILGNASVHSFTDLGLSGQLLIFLLVTTGVTLFALIKNYKLYPKSEDNTSMLSFELWMVIGVTVLGLSAFQVLIPTSIPVFNKLMGAFGIDSNLAPPSDQVAFYAKFQIWFAVFFGLVSGVAQLIYWRGIKDGVSFEKALATPLLSSIAISLVIIILGEVNKISYIALVATAVYALVTCVNLIFRVTKRNYKLFGGLLAHTGFSLMLIGFVFSAGYSSIVSQNMRINAPESSLPVHTIQENALLNRNQSTTFQDYDIRFVTSRTKTLDGRMMLDRDYLLSTNLPGIKVLAKDHYKEGELLAKKGDKVTVDTENVYYEIEVTKGGRTFTMFPRMQNNPNMGYVASPDIASFWNKDFYLHITNFPDPEKVQWSEPSYFELKQGQAFKYAGLTVKLTGSDVSTDIVGVPLSQNDIPITANFEVIDGENTYQATPLFLIKNGRVRLYPDEVKPLGLKLNVEKITPETGSIVCSVTASQRDWITFKAIEMPHVSLVWIGTLIMTLGIGLAVWSRLTVTVTVPSKLKVSHNNYKEEESEEPFHVTAFS